MESDRLAFKRLQQRLARREAAAAEAARRWPAHYVAFDLVHVREDVTGWPYERRHVVLESLFADRSLKAPLTLRPSTTDPEQAEQWLGWSVARLEGLCFKRLDEPYRPLRSWRKYKVRVITEAVIGAVTGSLASPRTVLLGRYDTAGQLQYAGRSTTLSQTAVHPRTGWTFSAGWGTQQTLDVQLVHPDVVTEVAVDVARDSAGRWRHPARPHRVRTDVDVAQVPLFGK
ncbi:ATP-dependent DNA ligase [Streptomyces sp. NPDC059680]|uniref:ATP-dependent DNA ligase n=1 Tax=Streptomyces sp. NPDC059680 TaxID=3346904 RepID=UPI0036CBF115